jgi:hypothetical protein
MGQYLLRPTAGAWRAPPTPGAGAGFSSWRTLHCTGGSALWSLSYALQCIKRRTNLRVLCDQRLKLTQPLLQTAAKLAQYISHTPSLSRSFHHDIPTPGLLAADV